MAQLNYKHLKYFWAVAHEGHLTRAAERLNLSQSALSSQIRRLEEQLGHALFERRGKRLVLTEAGQVALEHADTIFSTGEELLGVLSDRAGLTRRVFRVGALATLSRNFQIAFLRPLLGESDVDTIVRSGSLPELISGLDRRDLDVVLTNVLPPRDAATRWEAHRIAEQAVSLIGTPARVREDRDIAQLLGREPVILPTVESSIRLGFDTIVARLDIKLRVAAEVDDMAMMRLLAREDAGLAVLPPIVVRDELAAGTLIEAASFEGLTETFYAVTPRRRYPNPLTRMLIGGDVSERVVPERSS